MSIVTIRGDRSTDKTHAGLAVAALDGIRGRTVVWLAHSWAYAAAAQRDLVDLLPRPLVQKVRLVNGSNRVDLTGGGRVYFLSGRAVPSTSFAVPSANTFIFDDTPIPEWFERANPDARIYVTEKTGDDPEAGLLDLLTERLHEAAREFAAAAR